MKKVFALIISFVLILPAFAEEGDNKETVESVNYTFPMTYQGVTMFMDDLSVYEFDNYELLQPIYSDISKKRNMSLLVGGGLGTAGLILTLFNFNKFMQSEPGQDNSGNMMGFLGGGLLMTGAVGISVQIGPKQEDYHRMINRYNRENPDSQITIKTVEE